MLRPFLLVLLAACAGDPPQPADYDADCDVREDVHD